MVNPLIDRPITTPYFKRGPYWSLDRRDGEGVHTGADQAAPDGTRIVAGAGAGGKVVAVDYTSAYGWRVTIESIIDGVLGRDYYCHMPKAGPAVKVGQKVVAGQRIGKVGHTGNVTGSHLHLERRIHPFAFSLACFRDPIVIHRAQVAVVVVPIARPKVRPADVCSHTLWNLAGEDVVGTGKATFAKRIPEITAEMARIGSDVFSLLEIHPAHVELLEHELDKIGYELVVQGKGRGLAVKKALRTGRHAIYELPERGPADDDRFAVYLEVFIGSHAWLFSAGHFEHRSGEKYDRVRVQQGKEAFAKGERLRKSWGIDETRVSYGDDENSSTWVVDEAYEPNGYFDVFEGAWDSVNERVGTCPGWGKKTPHGYRIDKIKRHRRRPVRRAHVRVAAAGISDHLPVTVVYGTTTK